VTGELRRYLKEEVDRRVRARPDYLPPEQLALREALAAREYERACVICGESFTSSSGSARTCKGACRVALHKLRRSASREPITA
jgi:hypothetical protein